MPDHRAPLGERPIARRRFVGVATASVIAGVIGCKSVTNGTGSSDDESPERLVVPASNPPSNPAAPPPLGQIKLGLSAGRDALLHVPASYRPDRAAPLLVLLHGAGGSSSDWFGSYGARADALGMIILAPDSRAFTWDATISDFGPDVAFINRAFEHVFSRYLIDRGRLAIAGFSDGASYALSLGLANGDRFPNIIAYSPGFVAGKTRRGKPTFFVSHGTSDPILPIEQTSRPIVAELRQAGYSVEFREFAGRHEVPQAISDAALSWLVSRQG